jgi:hypothetical protein
MVGGVRSMAICFCITVSLPLNHPQRDASRATTRSVAVPSLTPGSLASATLTFFSATGDANSSAAMLVSPSLIESDFSPDPASATVISSGALPTTSASGLSRTTGGCDSKCGRK